MGDSYGKVNPGRVCSLDKYRAISPVLCHILPPPLQGGGIQLVVFPDLRDITSRSARPSAPPPMPCSDET